ncbi:Glycosyl transferase family 2 [Clostridium sp. DSM 8431]|uniref:glycosyltransferase n=1 Tax=Clostridium sp. DSM 8431 TaxID=1761781 RepID=UPI0008E92886|nr:glycosyltransferase [Clostridium sp. DSM 8431]SFU66189.1 Glycosyl transferase family 2 [Clostridium sp. DSM 8431]
MKSKYYASVIIPTYNRSNLLEGTLKSLLQQDINRQKFEVIIIDDGSTDDTHQVVDMYRDKLNIKYIYQEHVGFRVAAARNLGIKSSEGDICVFVDSGVLLKKDAINENIKIHSSSKEYAVIGYMYGFDEYSENEEKILSMNVDPLNVDKYIELLEKEKVFDMREKLYKDLGDDLTKWPAPWVIFWTGYASVKRDILTKVGMFDESFNTWGGEDTDIALAMYTNGVEIIMDRKLKSIHMPHDKFKTSISKEELKKRGKEKKEFIHSKYKLQSTEVYINTSSIELNHKIMKKKI